MLRKRVITIDHGHIIAVPTGNLDSINAQEIITLLQKINEFGTTIVLVTHNREIVNMLRKRVITIDHGHIIADQKAGKYLL
jgi:cell division transport system ATP-binding protein